MTINVAIVEDDLTAYENIKDLLQRYSSETGLQISIQYFDGGRSFLKSLKPTYDIVFMDINMPDMDGLETARRMRVVDNSVFLIFVTDLAQFAIKGYEVDASDFIVKPVRYEHLRQKLNRLVAIISSKKDEPKVFLHSENSNVIVNTSDILYIEIINHRLYYHTKKGIYDVYGSLSDIEKTLPSSFVRCNHCYLVNLAYVTAVKKYTVYIGEVTLMISHPKKKEFQLALTKFLGEQE